MDNPPAAFATEQGPIHSGEASDSEAFDEDLLEESKSVIRDYIDSLVKDLDSKESNPLKERVSKGYLWHHPPHPLFVTSKVKMNELDPKPFYLPTVSVDSHSF